MFLHHSISVAACSLPLKEMFFTFCARPWCPSSWPRRVVLYYCRRTSLSLRCFRLELSLRQKLLRQQHQERQDTPETETSAVPGGGGGGVADGGTNPPPTRGSAAIPAIEAGEVTAAATLNNVGVCLAVEGNTRLAAKALGVSSNATSYVSLDCAAGLGRAPGANVALGVAGDIT